MHAEPRKRSQALTILLSSLIIIYVLVALFLFVSWYGLQTIDTQAWRRDTLPVYIGLALLGALSAFGVMKWKRLGVYGLCATWLATGAMNLIFVRPIPYSSILVGVGLIIVFFLLVMPIWPKLE